MFSSIKRARLVSAFVHERSADYVKLAHLDFLEFQDGLLKTALSVGALVVGGLLFIGFLCIAAIVTAWDTDYRITTAWGVCVTWGLLCGLGAMSIKALLTRPKPFSHLVRVLVDDISTVRAES